MRKGKFGIVLAYYAVVAFALVILKQPLLCAVIGIVAIFVEKDEWLSRQTIQAFLLAILVEFFSTMSSIFAGLPLWFVSDFFSGVFSFVGAVAYIAAIVFSILAITKVLKGNDADVPVLSALAYKAYGRIKPTPVPPQPPQGYYTQQPPQGYPVPPAAAPQAQPVPPTQPTTPPVAAPTAAPETAPTAEPTAPAAAPTTPELVLENDENTPADGESK